jgi:hypothetical protein
MMSSGSGERSSARMHVHDDVYFMRKSRAPAGIDGRRNDDVPGEVLLGPQRFASFALKHLAEIDVRQNPVALVPGVLA